MGYSPTVCLNKLQAAGLTPACEALTNPFHCDDLQQISPVVHAFCGQVQQYYAPVQALVCIHYNPQGQPDQWKYFPPKDLIKKCTALGDPWAVDNCYCCCSCFAYDTLIAVPSGVEAIQFIAVGDNVLAGSLSKGGSSPKFAWNPVPVNFSAGVSGGEHSSMMYVVHDGGDLICTPDQVFMLASGGLTTASRLFPGDQLINKDGNPLTVKTVSAGSYTGGVHHISTGLPFNGNVDGHLLVAGGVVAGDYTLQLHFDSIPAALKTSNLAARPEIGTAAYAKAYTHLRQASAKVLFTTTTGQQTAKRVQTHSGLFTFYTESSHLLQASTAETGASLFTREQAIDLLENGQQLPLSNPIPKTEIANIFAIMKGFYPEFVYYLDWYQMEPNVYAIEEYGQKIIVVTGGLARMVGLSYEGLAMAVAHGIARFVGQPPKDPNGYVGTGAADYFAFGVISRAIWYGNSWWRSAQPAFQQINKLFSQISSENAGGDPNDPIGHPSIECRLEAIQSALAAGGLPACAGGPPPTLVALQAASPETGGVALTLNVAPERTGAVNAANYVFEPKATVISATIDAGKDFIIHLKADLTSGTKYKVTIQNLTTLLGDGVDSDHASAEFTAK
ncbi:MAG TPA: hypothetical protein VK738_02155 [Terriglobales bacterium]|nr:hypothetical protein [Terriglobales bacterium]